MDLIIFHLSFCVFLIVSDVTARGFIGDISFRVLPYKISLMGELTGKYLLIMGPTLFQVGPI